MEALLSPSTLLAVGLTSLAAWLYLTLLHGGFWRADRHPPPDDAPGDAPAAWPDVVAVVPARDEADVIAESLVSLLDQDYPGDFHVVLVDDHSADGTAARARRAAMAHPRGERLEILAAQDMPPGWVGKMWAVSSGIDHALAEGDRPTYLLLTDADIAHPPESVRELVAWAEAEDAVLVSLMVRLACRRGWERLLIPAFVYFFQQLYPFRWVSSPSRRTAGAAGGCMLVRADALEAAGGIAAIRGEIIDDCALAKRLKAEGSIRLGLTERHHSIRPYDGLGEIWRMVARTAYTQLRYSPWLLAGTVVGLVLLYLAPPLLTLTAPWHGAPFAAWAGGAAWLLQSLTFLPTLRLYRRSALLAPLLPVAGLLYLGMTLDSARRHAMGRGGHWKGRAMAGQVASSPSDEQALDRQADPR